ncbi:hypothetical protein [Streptomyces sp. 7N604]|uniref:hypothetical protein n=1 Tax=Streptomyces sp. 7N604 TaxID=3457415 RepID=UPI003FD59566
MPDKTAANDAWKAAWAVTADRPRAPMLQALRSLSDELFTLATTAEHKDPDLCSAIIDATESLAQMIYDLPTVPVQTRRRVLALISRALLTGEPVPVVLRPAFSNPRTYDTT